MIKGDNIGFGGGWIYATYPFGNTYICAIGSVDATVIHSMNTAGLCRIDKCTVYDDGGRRIFDDEDLAYAADYLSEQSLIADVARFYDISPDKVRVVEPEY